MWKALTADSILPNVLLGTTAVTGLVDAVSLERVWRYTITGSMGNVQLPRSCAVISRENGPNKRQPQMSIWPKRTKKFAANQLKINQINGRDD